MAKKTLLAIHVALAILGAANFEIISVLAEEGPPPSDEPVADAAGTTTSSKESDDDPYVWLEEIEGSEALSWVKSQSDATADELESFPAFDAIRDRLLSIYNSDDKLASVGIRGDFLYNYWRDAVNVRGIWRRTTMDEYRKEEPVWETMLDLDALSEVEGEDWVWGGPDCLPPEYEVCMINLSRGGSDASVYREFDMLSKTFVEESSGFVVPEAKGSTGWKDENTIWISTDFGPDSMTTSGYPRIVKEWQRGTSLDDAVTIFEGETDDVLVYGESIFTPDQRYDVVVRFATFFTRDYYLNKGEGELTKLDIPEDSNFNGFFKGQMMCSMRSDWEVNDGSSTYMYPSGSFLAIDLADFLDGSRNFEILFKPSDRIAFGSLSATSDFVIYSTLDNINGKLYRAMLGDDGSWSQEEIALPGLGTVDIGSTSYNDPDNAFFFSYTDYITPRSVYLVSGIAEPERIKSSPDWYDTTGVTVEQQYASSVDGTAIPYFLVKPAGFEATGDAPTVLYGYGGFEVSLKPRYSATAGSSWIERGGVYAVANIRGGGEFGPDWHQAAVRERKQTNFDDFIAVAEDLIANGITSSDHLGIMGGSQGGFLVGGSFVQRPDLFNAVLCSVPLLDMFRYNKLLAGASWQDEYGNPDTEDWENFMKFWSPYQNLDPEKDYPRVFFTTNTNDDRVHPGHARKMAAKMLEMNKPVFYFEDTEGGHGIANYEQLAYTSALEYSYFWKMLNASNTSSSEPETAPTTLSTTSVAVVSKCLAQTAATVIFGVLLLIIQ